MLKSAKHMLKKAPPNAFCFNICFRHMVAALVPNGFQKRYTHMGISWVIGLLQQLDGFMENSHRNWMIGGVHGKSLWKVDDFGVP